MGTKYMIYDYVLIGWQDDDLPMFGLIQDIAVLNNNALFVVKLYNTLGINRHYHSFVISRTTEVAIVWLSELQETAVFRAHHLSDGQLLITFRYHIENYV